MCPRMRRRHQGAHQHAAAGVRPASPRTPAPRPHVGMHMLAFCQGRLVNSSAAVTTRFLRSFRGLGRRVRPGAFGLQMLNTGEGRLRPTWHGSGGGARIEHGSSGRWAMSEPPASRRPAPYRPLSNASSAHTFAGCAVFGSAPRVAPSTAVIATSPGPRNRRTNALRATGRLAFDAPTSAFYINRAVNTRGCVLVGRASREPLAVTAGCVLYVSTLRARPPLRCRALAAHLCLRPGRPPCALQTNPAATSRSCHPQASLYVNGTVRATAVISALG